MLFYGCDFVRTGTLGEYERDRLEAVAMWIYRNVCRVSWIEKGTRAEVLGRHWREEKDLTKSHSEEKS